MTMRGGHDDEGMAMMGSGGGLGDRLCVGWNGNIDEIAYADLPNSKVRTALDNRPRDRWERISDIARRHKKSI